jgi:hypothetical protein
MTNISQWLISILILIAVFLGLYWLLPNKPNSPRGIVLPTVSNLTPKNNHDIAIIGNITNKYCMVAYVNVEMHAPKLSANAEIQSINYAKALAKKIGANALYLNVSENNREMANFIISSMAYQQC